MSPESDNGEEMSAPLEARLLRHLPHAVAAVDPELAIICWNPAASAMTRWPEREVLGRSLLDLVRFRQSREREELLAILAAWGEWKGELALLQRGGSEQAVDACIRRLPSAGREPDGFVVSMVDATTRRSSDAMLRRVHGHMRFQAELLSQVRDAVIAFDDERRIALWNPAAERHFGWRMEEAIGRSFDELLPRVDEGPDPRGRTMDAIKADGFFLGDVPVRHRDGRVLTVEISVARAHDESGNPIGFVSTGRDVSERRRVEEALRESEERYRALVHLCPDAVLVHVDGIVRFVNPASLRLFRAKEADELLGRKVIDLVHPDDRGKVAARIAAMRASGDEVPLVEERLMRFDGTVVNAEVAAVQLHYDGHAAILVVARDLTQRGAS